jgi:signal transduction histidine kinase
MNKVISNNPLMDYGINERLLSDFVLFLSDELRNPLSVILMKLDQITEQTKEDLELYRKIHILLLQVKNNSLIIAKIINDQIDNMDEIRPHITEFNVINTLNELTINIKRILSNYHVSLKNVLTGKALYIQADESFFERSLLNYISYAAKNTMKGQEIKIKLDLDGSGIKVSVQYNGGEVAKGDRFSETQEPNILMGFEPGLALVRKLIEMQNGHVWADDELEGENSLYFTLPIKSETEQSNFLVRTSLSIRDRVLMELADLNSGIESSF